jgi:hypothetical protein
LKIHQAKSQKLILPIVRRLENVLTADVVLENVGGAVHRQIAGVALT